MDIFLTILGVTVVAAGLNDIFHTLLHPSGSGRISKGIAAGLWTISRRTGHRLGHIVGPAAMATVIGTWALLQAVGWALIYYPHVPEGFSYSAGINPERYDYFSEALYVSMVALATLGYGDVVAVDPWLRLLTPVQALTGFALLTAALSWFNQIYPALGRRRTLAARLRVLQANGYAEDLDALGAASGSRMLEDISASIVQARIDLIQNTETYYFRESDSDVSLAASLPYALTLSSKAQQSAHHEIRLHGLILQTALEELGQHLKKQFNATGETTTEIFDFFTNDHSHSLKRSS